MRTVKDFFGLFFSALLPNLGDIDAEKLTTTVQRAYREKRTQQGAKPASVNRELQILRRAYKLA